MAVYLYQKGNVKMIEKLNQRWLLGNKIHFPKEQYVPVCIRNEDPLKVQEVKVLPPRKEGVNANRWLLEIGGKEYLINANNAKEETVKRFITALTLEDPIGYFLYKNAIIMANREHVLKYSGVGEFDPVFEMITEKFEDDHIVLRPIAHEIDPKQQNENEGSIETIPVELQHVTVNGRNIEAVLFTALEDISHDALLYFKTTEEETVFTLHIVDGEDDSKILSLGSFKFPKSLREKLPEFMSYRTTNEVRYLVNNLGWALSFNLNK